MSSRPASIAQSSVRLAAEVSDDEESPGFGRRKPCNALIAANGSAFVGVRLGFVALTLIIF